MPTTSKRDAAIELLLHVTLSDRVLLESCKSEVLFMWLYSLGYRYNDKTHEWEAVLLTPASKISVWGEQGRIQAA